MEDPELIAICEALIDADPTMSGYHESHIAVKMPYALAVQKRLRSLTAWQPIETAPKDGTWFLAWYPKENSTDDYGDFIEMTNWEPVSRELNADSWTIGGINPTHWLPLPTPPEAEPAH